MVPKAVEMMVGNDIRRTGVIEFGEWNQLKTNLMSRVLGTTPCLILVDELLSQFTSFRMPVFGEPI